MRPNQALPTACFVRVRRCADLQSRLQQEGGSDGGHSEEENSGRGNRGRDGGRGRGRVETKIFFPAAIIASWKCAEKITKTFGVNKKMLTFAEQKELHYKKAITGPQFREEVRSTSNNIAKKFVLANIV